MTPLTKKDGTIECSGKYFFIKQQPSFLKPKTLLEYIQCFWFHNPGVYPASTVG
jgi:hypothetical protein